MQPPARVPASTAARVAVLVPVKASTTAKLRLASALDAAERAALARSMAGAVLRAAVSCPRSSCATTTRSRSWATAQGADVLWRPGRGLNGAVDDGVTALAAAGFDRVVVAHADLPLADRPRVAGTTSTASRWYPTATTTAPTSPAYPRRAGSGSRTAPGRSGATAPRRGALDWPSRRAATRPRMGRRPARRPRPPASRPRWRDPSLGADERVTRLLRDRTNRANPRAFAGGARSNLPVPASHSPSAPIQTTSSSAAGARSPKWAAAGCVVHHIVLTDGSKGTWDVDADTAALVVTPPARTAGRGEAPSGPRARSSSSAKSTVSSTRPAWLRKCWRRGSASCDPTWSSAMTRGGATGSTPTTGTPACSRATASSRRATRTSSPSTGVAHHRPTHLLLFEADAVEPPEDVTATVEAKLAALEGHASQFESTMRGRRTKPGWSGSAAACSTVWPSTAGASASPLLRRSRSSATVNCPGGRPRPADRRTPGLSRSSRRPAALDDFSSVSATWRRWVTTKQKSSAVATHDIDVAVAPCPHVAARATSSTCTSPLGHRAAVSA